MTYSVDYFIEKFDAIPDENWFMNSYVSMKNAEQKCALGHCGVSSPTDMRGTKESNALEGIIELVAFVNDGDRFRENKFGELGDTPKERILNALLLVKCDLWKESLGG